MGKKETENPFAFREASDSTGFLLWQAHNRWQREIRKALKIFDLTHAQFVILASAYWLALREETVTQVQIARLSQSDVMMTSNVIRALEKKALLKRKEHRADTRAKVVILTEKGKKRLQEAVRVVEAFDRHFFGAVKEPAAFNRALLDLAGQDKLKA